MHLSKLTEQENIYTAVYLKRMNFTGCRLYYYKSFTEVLLWLLTGQISRSSLASESRPLGTDLANPTRLILCDCPLHTAYIIQNEPSSVFQTCPEIFCFLSLAHALSSSLIFLLFPERSEPSCKEHS